MIGVESLTLEGGGSVDDLDLDFTLPGYPDIDLKVCVWRERMEGMEGEKGVLYRVYHYDVSHFCIYNM